MNFELDLDIENIFTDESDVNKAGSDSNTEENTETNVEQVNPEDLFAGGVDVSEDGSNGEDVDLNGDNDGDKTQSSPKENFYSTIASSFKEDGIFPDLSDEDLKGVETAEDFAELVQKQIESRFDATQKRIADALANDVEPSEVKMYEDTLSQLEKIDDDFIKEESTEAEDIRRKLIYQDYINKGFKPERAKKEMEKSFNAGTDIEDAVEALNGNKEYFNNKYNTLIEDSKKAKQEELKKQQKQSEELLDKFIKTEEPYPGLKVTEIIRKKALDNMTKPVHKDEYGNQLTEVQKFAKENPVDFQYKLGLLYTLTDGFKDISKIAKGEVQRQTKSKIRELEHTLNSTRVQTDGSINFIGATDDDETDFNINGLKLDI